MYRDGRLQWLTWEKASDGGTGPFNDILPVSCIKRAVHVVPAGIAHGGFWKSPFAPMSLL
jgi:hypothetical protein